MREGSGPPDAGQTRVVGELQVTLSAVALGPDYPPTAISAEIGRVAVAAARVDQEYALLLHALHSGKRADWALEGVQKHSSIELRRQVLQRLDELFEGQLVSDARIAVHYAYDALNRRHAVMHTVWTLEGPDAMTS